MVSNPMQRKSRNAFLLGVIITLVITGAIIALLFLQLKQKNEELKAELAAKVRVYTLTQNVKAGQTLTEDMFALKSIHKESIPSNATSDPSIIETWFLQTKEGESVCTDRYGLYLDRSLGDKSADTIIEVFKNSGSAFKDSNGKEVATGDSYVDVNGTIEKVSSGIQTDEYGSYIVDTQNVDKMTRIYQEALTDEFYFYKIDTSTINTDNAKTRVKEYIEIKNVPVLAKVNMNANTVITSQLVVQSNELVTDDTRQEQYNMITLPIDLMTNDYVDIRLKTPSGQNFIVISKTQVEVPMNEDGSYVPDTIRVNLREDEILAMSSAIVEAYGLKGSELYVTKYVEPAMQQAALPTYTPNSAVTAQIQTNPNIVDVAKAELASRYSEASKKLRNDYLQQSINNSQTYLINIETSVEQNLTDTLSIRQKYLESLEY